MLEKRRGSQRVRKGMQECSGGNEKQQKLVQEQQCMEGEEGRGKNREERVAGHGGKDGKRN